MRHVTCHQLTLSMSCTISFIMVVIFIAAWFQGGFFLRILTQEGIGLKAGSVSVSSLHVCLRYGVEAGIEREPGQRLPMRLWTHKIQVFVTGMNLLQTGHMTRVKAELDWLPLTSSMAQRFISNKSRYHICTLPQKWVSNRIKSETSFRYASELQLGQCPIHCY